MSQAPLTALGPYPPLELLFSGSVSTLYRGWDPQGRAVALKVLRPFVLEDAAALERLRQELERLRAHPHPGIVAPFQVGELEVTAGSPRRPGDSPQRGQFCLVSAFVEGVSVEKLLGQPWSLAQMRQLFLPVAEAVAHAHALGVLHRNLKPSNILLAREGRVCVLDFGLPLLTAALDPSLHVRLTTPLPSYSAPEQNEGHPLDPRSDVYALGVLLYHMATGQVPFSGLERHTVLGKQLSQAPLRPSQRNPSLPLVLETVILKALRLAPERRHGSVEELCAAFQDALAQSAPEEVRVTEGPSQAPADRGMWLPTPSPDVAAREVSPTTIAASPPALTGSEELWRLCRVCQQVNPASGHYCARCWASLAAVIPLPFSELDLPPANPLLRLFYRRPLAAAFALLVLPLVLWGAGHLALTAVQGLPPPATRVTSLSGPGEWAVSGHDLANTGYVPPPAPSLQGHLRWTLDTGAPLRSPPALVDGTLYLATAAGRLLALEASRRRSLWEVPTTGPTDSAPAVAGALLYLGFRDKNLVAFHRTAGERRWSFRTLNPLYASPIVHEGMVYVGSSDDVLYALDAATGELRWRYQARGRIYAGAALKDGILYFTSGEGSLYALDAATGARRYDFRLPRGTLAAPALGEEYVYVGGNDGVLRALQAKARSGPWDWEMRLLQLQLWAWGFRGPPDPQVGFGWGFDSKDPIVAAPALTPQRVYAGNVAGRFFALDAASGAKLWEFRATGAIKASPIVVGDVVYVGAEDGRLYALAAPSGELRWSFTAGGPILMPPVYAAGLLFVGSDDGKLYALE